MSSIYIVHDINVSYPLIEKALPNKAEDMFCHAIYVAWHAVNRAYNIHLKPLGLTYPQYIALTLLWEEDEQTISSLAKKLNMDSNTLTPLMKRLEALGHVKRQRDTRDERRVFVRLTKSGIALKNKANSITACMIEGTGLSVKELEDMQKNLAKLTFHLKNSAST